MIIYNTQPATSSAFYKTTSIGGTAGSGLKIAIDFAKCKNAATLYDMLYCDILCSAATVMQHHGLKAIRMYYIPKSKVFITEI